MCLYEASKRYFALLEKLASYPNYETCLKAISQEDPYDRAKHSRAILIYASREDNAPRLFEYDYQEIMGILSKDYNDYAEELLPGEISKLPQYYGQQTLIDLASGNIEQFLSIASKMYEMLLSKKIMDTARYDLTPEDQKCSEITNALLPILENGAQIVVATGRGKSVGESFINTIDCKYWPQIKVGYYNGACLLALGDEAKLEEWKFYSEIVALNKCITHRKFG